MIGSFGRKHKGFGKNYGKKDTSYFKKGLLAGGMLLTAAGIYASAGDKKTHQETEYPLIASEEGGGLGHSPEVVAKQKLVGQKVGESEAPAPTITLAEAEDSLAPQPSDKKKKIAAGLKLASEVVSGDVGKVRTIKKGIDIARGQGEAQSTKSLEEQIKHAEKSAKSRKTKISRESVGVGKAPMIGPVAPPEFFSEETSKKQKVAKLFAKPFRSGN